MKEYLASFPCTEHKIAHGPYLGCLLPQCKLEENKCGITEARIEEMEALLDRDV